VRLAWRPRLLLLAAAIAATAELLGLSAPAGSTLPDPDGLSLSRSLTDFVTTPEFADLYLMSFTTVLSDSQRADYLALPHDNRRGWRRRFWNASDPTPGTERNEFLEEHIRRLRYVRDHFLDPGTLTWDDRGEIVLRYGIPPSRVPIQADISLAYGARGLIPPQEMWSYPKMNIVFQFVDPNLDGSYQIGADTKMLSARGRPTPVPSGPRDPRFQDVPIRTDMEAAQETHRHRSAIDEGRRAIERVPVSYGYSPPAAPLPLFYEVVTAKGPDGRADLAVNYQLLATDVARRGGQEGQPVATLVKRIRIMSEDYNLVGEDGRTVTIAGEDEDATAAPFVTDEWRLDAAPGTYIVGISVSDTVSGRSGHGRSRVTVDDYWTGRLSMSDIQLGTSERSGDRFRRLRGAVVPHPVRAFREGDDMVVYFELYGLSRDRDGGARFTVRTEVAGEGHEEDPSWLSTFFERLFPGEEPSVATEVVSSGDVPDAPYSFVLSLEGFEEDSYQLAITVRDVNSKQAATKSATFTVLDEESWAKVTGTAD